MNARCFKTVFSEHLGCLVAVGEHATSQGKSSGESPAGAAVGAVAAVFIGALVLSMAWVSLAWAAPAANALPTGGTVVQGAASVAQSASQLTINQSSQRAAINWQSFDIGAAAQVNVVQPNAQAVLLNRVVGQSPSQIFGQLQANGHVILVNPNGVLFGKDGSVNAASFTASTLGITDANFMAGNMVYERNGSTAGVVNQGTIQVSPGGYVALLGASVSNEGKIIAPQGGVALGAANVIRVPVSGSGRVKLELTAADINASVSNTGQIVSQGGQVYMQALALNQAAAQVMQSGSIDTTGEQGGAVHLLADGGTIKVDGSITANSKGTDDKGQARKGGDIIIGRDEETGVLARASDVSGAKLESNGGFVETSGEWLGTTGVRVLAKDWLLDPSNITIAASGASGTAYGSNYTSAADSVILASDISAHLTAGTSVTLATGAGGASLGDINVNASIAKTGGADATLTLKAHNDIVVAANTTITSTTGALNVVLNADLDGSGAGGIAMNSGSGITSFGGNITLGGGTAGNGTGSAFGSSSTYHGISLNGASLSSGAGNVSLTGTSYTSGGGVFGVNMVGATTISTTSGAVSVTGTGQTSGTYGYGMYMNGGKITTGTGNVTVNAQGSNRGSSDALGMQVRTVGAITTSGGNISVTAASRGVAGNYNIGINFAGGGSFVAGSTGTVTVSGTGGSVGSASEGVSTANITTSGAAVNITGASTVGSDIIVGSSAINTAGGNVTFTANSYVGSGSEVINAGTGTVSLQNRTGATTVNVGGTGTDASGLDVSTTELAKITAGKVVVGRNDATGSGAVTVSALDLGAMGNTSGSLSVLSGGNIAVNGAVTKTAGTNATLSLLANNDITVAANTNISSTSGALNVVLNSDSDGSGAGAIVMNTGSGITSKGGNITLGGGAAGNGSGYAVGNSTNANGILLNGASLLSAGGNITMRGKSTSGTTLYDWRADGIRLRTAAGSNLVDAGSGQIVMDGVSVSTSNDAAFGIDLGYYGETTHTTQLLSSSNAATAISLTGVGAVASSTISQMGVVFNDSTTVSATGTGGVSITATTGGKGVAFAMGSTGVNINTANAAVTITADSSTLNGNINAGTGTVTLQNLSSGTTIDVGGTSADVLTPGSLKLGITAAELGRITAGTIIVGRRDVNGSGNVAMNAINMGALGNTSGNLSVLSGGNIAVNGAVTKTAGTDATLSLLANSNITVATNNTIVGSSGKLNVLMNSDSDATAGGGIIFNSGSGVTSNGGNITLGGGSALDGSGFATADGTSTVQGISLSTATIDAGGGNIAMKGKTAVTNSQASLSNIDGIYMAGGSISTTGSGTIDISALNQNTDTLSKGFELTSGTITGGSTGAVTITGDSRPTTTSYSYIKGAIINGTVTSAGGDINIVGYGGQGALGDDGVNIGGSVMAVGSGAISITGTASSGGSGANVGVSTSGSGTISSVNGNIAITGTGGTGNGANIRNHGVVVGGSNAIASTGTGNISVVGTVKNNDTTYSSGVLVNSGGLTTASGYIDITGTPFVSTQPAIGIAAALTAGGNVYLHSAGGYISTTAAISGANVSIDQTGGAINSTTGTITAGTALNGTNVSADAIKIAAAINATGNVNIYGRGSTAAGYSGVNLTSAGSITSTGANAAINISSNTNVLNAAAIKNTASTGTGASINLTSTSGTITGTGAMGDTTNKNASVTFTQAGTSTYSGAINAANFTKAGAGSLTLDSWVATTPATTNISNAYTVKSGGLSLKPGSTLAWIAPVSVNVENASSFSLDSNSSSRWNNTAFNFTGGLGGGTMNLAGNPIGAGSTTNAFSTSGGATNTIVGGLNANGANVNFNLTAATSGTTLLDGSFAAIAFTQNTQGGYGLGSGGGGAGTVNITGGGNLLFKDTVKATTFNVNAGAVQFGDGTAATVSAPATLDATNVSIASGAKLIFNRAEAYSSASVITGAGSLIQGGTGVLTLTGNSSAFAGATTVNAGKTLAIGTGGSLGAAGSTIALVDAASNLSFTNTSGTSTVASTISGLGTVTENGAGGVGLLLGNNTYTGTTTITAGTLQAGNGGTTGSLGTGAVTDNSALVYNRSDNVTVANTISGTGTFTQAGTGAVLFPNSNAGYTGQTYVDSGKLSFGSLLTSGTAASQYWSSQFNVAAGAILDFNAPTGVSLNNRGTILTGAGTITKTGGGTVNWNSTDVFFNMLAGSLIDVQQGVLTASASYHGKWTNNLSSLNVAANAVFNGAEADVRVDALTGSGSVALGWSNLGSLTVGVNGTAAGTYNATAGTATFSGVISPTGTTAGLTKIGAGTQVLTGANTYTGTTTISAGVLQIGDGGTTGTLGTGGITNNSSLVFNRSDTGLVVGSAISGTGTVTQTGTGKTTLSANNSWSGATTINAGTLQIGNGSNTGALGTSAVSVAANANLSFYRNDASLTIANSISGAGSVNFLGTGVSSQSSYYLTGNNSSLSGSINVSSSRIGITAANQVGTAAMTINSGAGLYASGSFTINNALSLAGNGWLENTYGQLGALRLQNGTVYAGAITLAADARIGAYGSTGTVSGAISGAKSLDFNSGSGKVILTADNAYTGATTVSGGTLQVGNAGSTGTLGTGDVTLSNNANLNYLRSAATTIANNISGTGNPESVTRCTK